MSDLPKYASAIYKAWKVFKSENIRFLGYGDPHIPSHEERTYHAFVTGYRVGRRDEALDFKLPEGSYIAAIDIIDEEERE